MDNSEGPSKPRIQKVFVGPSSVTEEKSSVRVGGLILSPSKS